MIFFDITKTGAAGHRSGLTRVSARLAAELPPDAVTTVDWRTARENARAGDWFFTSELFSEDERPGFTEFLEKRTWRAAAVFHDAIPLKHPTITWPQSVARHPGYMKLLARFDRVWAVSEASRRELVEFWQWQDVEQPPPVEVLALGADFNAAPRVTKPAMFSQAGLLCLGILEPRKNQLLLLDVAEELWRDGLAFELHLVGRVNPHFGKPVVARIKTLQRKYRGLRFHEAASDQELARLYAATRAVVFPTIAEGCGLPLLESLWMGVPCICSDLPVLRENAEGGGCLRVAVNDRAAWAAALRRVLMDATEHAKLVTEAILRPLPTWKQAAETIATGLR
jgi:glycosyltransferase involved in cell wall biosynthesis